MALISVTNTLDDNSATSDITLVGVNFDDLINGLTDGTKDISISKATFASTVTTDGIISMADGTVAIPSLTFTNDLDCGLFRIGVNDIGFAINGAIVMEFGSAITVCRTHLRLFVTDTDGATEGDIWFDDSENKIKFYNGTTVKTIAVE